VSRGAPANDTRRHQRAAAPAGAPDIPQELLVGLAKLVRSMVQEEVARQARGGNVDPEIPHWEWWFCTSRRAALDLAKTGAIEGVRAIGAGRSRAYLARRSALEAYVADQAEQAAPADDFEAAMGRSGLRRPRPRSA
jgi:hypothetical protein